MAFSLPVLDAIGFASQIYGGFSKDQAYHSEAGFEIAQGAIEYNQSVIDANIIREQATMFASKQEMQYIGSGVVFGGSDLITLRQTKLFANEYANSVEARGEAEKTLANQKAQISKNMGNASLISGLASGAMDLVKLGAAVGMFV